jgi:NTP pyrophosphatase (non-canonical NTP hydrolase)
MSGDPTVREFQATIDATFGAKDRARGLAGTFMWFTEEVGELARALKKSPPDRANLEEEFADVFAWLATLASIAGVELSEVCRRYAAGCPRCGSIPCGCSEKTRFSAPGA